MDKQMKQAKMQNFCQLTGAGFTWVQASRLQEISHSLHTLDENECNWGLTKRQETRQANLEKEANEIAAARKLEAYHQGDPRGWSLYLINPGEEDYTKGVGIFPHGN